MSEIKPVRQFLDTWMSTKSSNPSPKTIPRTTCRYEANETSANSILPTKGRPKHRYSPRHYCEHFFLISPPLEWNIKYTIQKEIGQIMDSAVPGTSNLVRFWQVKGTYDFLYKLTNRLIDLKVFRIRSEYAPTIWKTILILWQVILYKKYTVNAYEII